MALLDGFKVMPLKEKLDDSYLTISEKMLKFNYGTVKVLQNPVFVQLMLNEKRMQIAIRPAQINDEDIIPFAAQSDGKEKPVYVKEPEIQKALQKIAVLQRNGIKLTQTIKGHVYPEEKVIIYDLGESVESEVKPRGRRKRE